MSTAIGARVYGRPAHRASDLTVGHVVPLAAGGAPFDIANTAVLCRSCNSTKGASTDPGRASRQGPTDSSCPPARARLWHPEQAVLIALRLAFVPLLLMASKQSPMEVLVVCGACAVALAPIPAARLRPSGIDDRVPIAVALLPLTEATGRILDLYEASAFPYDTPAHALEVGAATSSSCVSFDHWRPVAPRREAVVHGILVGLTLALGWEAVEWSTHLLTGANLQHGVDDTLVDVAAGLIGAAFAGWLAAAPRKDG